MRYLVCARRVGPEMCGSGKSANERLLEQWQTILMDALPMGLVRDVERYIAVAQTAVEVITVPLTIISTNLESVRARLVVERCNHVQYVL